MQRGKCLQRTREHVEADADRHGENVIYGIDELESEGYIFGSVY